MLNPALIDRISSGICLIDKDLQVLLWNASMEKMTGVSGCDISGKGLVDFFPLFKESSVGLRLKMVLSNGIPLVFSPLLHKNLFKAVGGNVLDRYLETTVTSLVSDDGSVSLLFTVRDVSELNQQIVRYREMRDKALQEVKRRKAVEEELKKANSKLMELANTDPLTGLLNRRRIGEMLLNEIERCDRHGVPFTVLLCDIDHFKQINDTCGHDSGDKVLVLLSQIFKENLRSLDGVARWGGEEFLVLLPGSPEEDGRTVAEKLRHSILSTDFGLESENCMDVTLTFGVSQYRDGEGLDSLIKKADVRLYKGKSRGRNCVDVSDPS